MDSTINKNELLANMHGKDSLQSNTVDMDSTLNKMNQDILTMDSLQQDSTQLLKNQDQPVVKAKKRNIFVRFFRWLFGIERRQRKRAEKASNQVLKDVPNAKVKISNDSIQLQVDSINIDVKELKEGD